MEFLSTPVLNTTRREIASGEVTSVTTSEGVFVFGHNRVDPETFETSLGRADQFRAALHAAYKPGVDVWLVTCAPDLLPPDLKRWHVCPWVGMRELRVGYTRQGTIFTYSVTPKKVQRRDLKKARKAKRKRLRQ